MHIFALRYLLPGVKPVCSSVNGGECQRLAMKSASQQRFRPRVRNIFPCAFIMFSFYCPRGTQRRHGEAARRETHLRRLFAKRIGIFSFIYLLTLQEKVLF